MTTSTLWGTRLNTHDIAKFLITEELAKTPFIGFKRNFNSNADMSIKFYKHGEEISLCNQIGLYVYFRRIENHLECLYVGYTEESFPQRGYRWMKELERKSRPDESHPGAIVARDEYGVKSSDNFYMKIIPYKNMMWTYQRHNCTPAWDAKYIDEHVAYELNALCNKNVRYHRAGVCEKFSMEQVT